MLIFGAQCEKPTRAGTKADSYGKCRNLKSQKRESGWLDEAGVSEHKWGLMKTKQGKCNQGTAWPSICHSCNLSFLPQQFLEGKQLKYSI